MTAGAAESGRSPGREQAGSWVDVDTSGGTVRVAVHGDLDATTSEAIVATVIASFPEAAGRPVEVDMGDAGFVDSTGLGSLVRLRLEARAHGSRLTLVELDQRLAKLLRLTGLDGDLGSA